MGKIGLLVLTNPLKITRLIPSICEHVCGTLYVQYLPLLKGKKLTHSRSSEDALKISQYSRIINEIYSQTATVNNLDVRVLLQSMKYNCQGNIVVKKPIEVLIFDEVFSNDEINSFVRSCASNLTVNCSVVTNDLNSANLPVLKYESSSEDSKTYDNVVLGGTFDRLHNGHKIMLSEAVLRCKKRLTVGVTDKAMIKCKILWELIQPCSQRIRSVEDFLQDVDPSLDYNVVPIEDLYGPTKEDPSLEMIVVSMETLRGGHKVNEERQRRGLSQLDIHTVTLLETDSLDEQEEEKKLSSSNCRMRLLGTRLRTPHPRPNLAPQPYVIGLMGSTASGKSSLSNYLTELGAGVVECDKMAHHMYAKGEELHGTLVHTFGESIVGPDGEIDRRTLGAIVFSDKGQLEQLNTLLWPAMLHRILEQVQDLRRAGHRVVVLDAAVLLQAGWDAHCHEVWGCIIPAEESVRRLQERNGLNEEEARQRVASQPTNEDVVSQSDVVFSPAWSVEFTRRQVQRAWTQLLKEQPSLA